MKYVPSLVIPHPPYLKKTCIKLKYSYILCVNNPRLMIFIPPLVTLHCALLTLTATEFFINSLLAASIVIGWQKSIYEFLAEQ